MKLLSYIFLMICVFIKTAESQSCASGAVALLSTVPDSALSASSYFKSWAKYAPPNGRLGNENGAGAWCPSTKTGEFIQVKFAGLQTICSVQTQGREAYKLWMTKFNVRTSTDCQTYTSVQENGAEKAFSGNKDPMSIVTNELPAPVKARCVRIYPLEFEKFPCLRFDLRGVKGDKFPDESVILKKIEALISSQNELNKKMTKVDQKLTQVTQLQNAQNQKLTQVTQLQNAQNQKLTQLQNAQNQKLTQVTQLQNAQNQRITQLQNQQSKKFSEVSSQVRTVLSRMGYNSRKMVFHIMKTGKLNYALTLAQAKSHCKGLGATLATYRQLHTAFKLGMQMCSCGWLADGSSRYPQQWPGKGCLDVNGTPRILTCDWRSTWNAYCFKFNYNGPVVVHV